VSFFFLSTFASKHELDVLRICGRRYGAFERRVHVGVLWGLVTFFMSSNVLFMVHQRVPHPTSLVCRHVTISTNECIGRLRVGRSRVIYALLRALLSRAAPLRSGALVCARSTPSVSRLLNVFSFAVFRCWTAIRLRTATTFINDNFDNTDNNNNNYNNNNHYRCVGYRFTEDTDNERQRIESSTTTAIKQRSNFNTNNVDNTGGSNNNADNKVAQFCTFRIRDCNIRWGIGLVLSSGISYVVPCLL
jgi:hypothetical protein